MNYDYEIDIIDEFGGKTLQPTLGPTLKPTGDYLPSSFLSDPFHGIYTAYFMISFMGVFIAALIFISTRRFFNRKEERDMGKWSM